jgi:formate-dependent nitrite reductase cytochrome c552 subunit
MIIYYAFEKITGEYAGSGTPFIENETHNCTAVTVPDYDSEVEKAFFDGEKWVVVQIPADSWLKADIQAYLTANGIDWTTSMTKAQLLELI